MILVRCFGLFVLCVPVIVSAQHGHWIDKYYSTQHGIRRSCCGPQDCLVVRARIVMQTPHEILAEANGIPLRLHPGSVHISEDERDYACVILSNGRLDIRQDSIRCLFLAPGS